MAALPEEVLAAASAVAASAEVVASVAVLAVAALVEAVQVAVGNHHLSALFRILVKRFDNFSYKGMANDIFGSEVYHRNPLDIFNQFNPPYKT